MVTAGTAIREALNVVAKEGGKVVGFVVALDRAEQMPAPREQKEGIDDGRPRMSALGQIRKEFGVPTASIVTLDDLIAELRGRGDTGDIERLEEYRSRYRASD